MRKLLALLLCIVVSLGQLNAQNKVISGKVTDPNGRPVSGASIVVKGFKGGTVTDADGAFTITVAPTAKSITASAVGFAPQTIAIGSGAIVFKLAASDAGLQEVVVVGYQALRKTEVTGAVVTIGAKEVTDKPLTNFTQLIQGKSPGVQVTSASGRPGINAFIRIRGTGSIGASSDPLILVDGVVVNTAAYNLINADEIEDITVLKDASATAIYGSRGSNGVLLITTKKGRGASSLSYTFRYGSTTQQPLNHLSLMDARQKLQYEYDFGPNYLNPVADTMVKARYGGTATLFSITDAQRQDIWNTMIARAANWDKELMQHGMLRTHEIALQGGADKFRYYFSLNKSDNQGVEKVSYWNRIGGRLNTEYQANEWFKIGSNMGVSHSVENVNRELFNGQAIYTMAQLINPWEPFNGSDGKMNITTLGQNALETAIYNPNVADRIASFATVFGEAKFFKNLTLKSQLGINYNTLSQEYYLEPGSYLAGVLGYNQKRDNGNREFLYSWTNTANWRQTINNDHNINILAGTEFTKDKFYSYSLTARGFPTASVTTLENGATPTQATTSRYDWSLISYFASVGYDYKKKYFLSASGRRDGSSRFGKNNLFANFWSVGAAWDIKSEDFITMKEISSLKLRGSVGTSGNNNLGSGAIAQYYALGTYALNVNYNNQPAASPSQIANPDLTWEQNNNYDMGLEFGLFDNRLTGSVDYYYRKTSRLLYPVNISLTTGFST
ncbi:MAG: SusC/RagA family TonB-linked outer membrane protein, partial [Bacteroidetes bacterium]|nr:SusC/RagA family TonB-linked outer membrane protein [Bacteroidota bacterium]